MNAIVWAMKRCGKDGKGQRWHICFPRGLCCMTLGRKCDFRITNGSPEYRRLTRRRIGSVGV